MTTRQDIEHLIDDWEPRNDLVKTSTKTSVSIVGKHVDVQLTTDDCVRLLQSPDSLDALFNALPTTDVTIKVSGSLELPEDAMDYIESEGVELVDVEDEAG